MSGASPYPEDTLTTELASELRILILEIRDLYHELPDTIAHIAGLHAISYAPRHGRSNDVTVPGGDALSLHAGGTDNTVNASRHGNRDHAPDNHPNDPPSVLAVLTRIEDHWRENQHQPAADATSLTATIQYLIANTPWAVDHHDNLSDDLSDLKALRGRLRSVTGHTDAPKPSDAPCIDCNGRIVQRYGTTGLDDTRECSRCGNTYTPTQYALAVQNRLEDVRDNPDKHLTAAEARTLWGLSEKQLYTWEARDKIAPIGHDHLRRRLYRNGDIAKLRGRTA